MRPRKVWIILKALLFNARSTMHLSSESPFKPTSMCSLHDAVGSLAHLYSLMDKVSPIHSPQISHLSPEPLLLLVGSGISVSQSR